MRARGASTRGVTDYSTVSGARDILASRETEETATSSGTSDWSACLTRHGGLGYITGGCKRYGRSELLEKEEKKKKEEEGINEPPTL